MKALDLGERLSAYLDGELSPLERAALEQELERSDEARQWLEELRAVDRLARELPLPVAPPVYRHGFSTRVRERLEKERRPRALPRWTGRWTAAAAAALFVAVLLPLLSGPGGEPKDDFSSVPRPRLSGPDAQAVIRPLPRPEVRAAEDRPTPEALTETQAQSERALQPVRRAKAVPATGSAAATQRRTVEEARRRSDAPDGARGSAAASRQAPALEGFVPRAPAPVPPAPKAAHAEARSLDEAGPVDDAESGTPGFAAAPDSEQRYRALRARRPSTLNESRRLREEWRLYASAHPSSEHADEARVQVIEQGLRAYALGGLATDQETAQRDGTAYLERADAAQSARVRALLEGQ